MPRDARGGDAPPDQPWIPALPVSRRQFADVRVSRHWTESVGTRERQIPQVGKTESYGVGVRALIRGSWGFSATRDVARDALARAAREATAIATANDRVDPADTILAGVRTFNLSSVSDAI